MISAIYLEIKYVPEVVVIFRNITQFPKEICSVFLWLCADRRTEQKTVSLFASEFPLFAVVHTQKHCWSYSCKLLNTLIAIA